MPFQMHRARKDGKKPFIITAVCRKSKAKSYQTPFTEAAAARGVKEKAMLGFSGGTGPVYVLIPV